MPSPDQLEAVGKAGLGRKTRSSCLAMLSLEMSLKYLGGDIE